MKKNYVKPQTVIRKVHVKNYILGVSTQTQSVENRWDGTGQFSQLTKERDDIWGSESNEESAW